MIYADMYACVWCLLGYILRKGFYLFQLLGEGMLWFQPIQFTVSRIVANSAITAAAQAWLSRCSSCLFTGTVCGISAPSIMSLVPYCSAHYG